jgi:hypothetical protein
MNLGYAVERQDRGARLAEDVTVSEIDHRR